MAPRPAPPRPQASPPVAEKRTFGARSGSVASLSHPGAVVEINHAVAETAFVEQFELQADIVGQGLLAASHHDGRDEQVPLVDQPGLDCLSGKVGTANVDVTFRSRFYLPNRFRVEVPLDPRRSEEHTSELHSRQ